MDDGELVRVQLLGLPVQARLRFSQHLQDLTRELSLVQIGAQQHPEVALSPRLLQIAAELNGPYAAFRAAPDAVVQEALAAGQDHCDVVYTVPPSAGAFLQRLGEVLEEADEFCRGRADLLILPAAQEVVAYRQWVVAESGRQLAGGAPHPWRAHPYAPLRPHPAPTVQGQDARAAPPAAPPASTPPTEGVRTVHLPPDERPGAPRAPLVLESVASSVAAARRYVREVLSELGAQDLEEPAELGVSELVTNAVLHAQSAFTLSVRRVAGGRIRIEVSDGSPLRLQSRQFAATATTGRGLRLVAASSFDWGVHELPGARTGKTVWFEPRPDDAGTSFAGHDWSTDLDGLL